MSAHAASGRPRHKPWARAKVRHFSTKTPSNAHGAQKLLLLFKPLHILGQQERVYARVGIIGKMGIWALMGTRQQNRSER